MKNASAFCISALIVTALVLPATMADAAGPSDSFVGIPWGASRAAIETTMAERGYTKDPDSKVNVYVYNGEFAGYKADLVFKFINNKLYEGKALLLWHDPNNWRIDQYFKELEKQLVGKYGKPLMTYRANGREEWAPWNDFWALKDQNTEINLTLSKQWHNLPKIVDGHVNVTYTNKTLMDLEKQRARDKDL